MVLQRLKSRPYRATLIFVVLAALLTDSTLLQVDYAYFGGIQPQGGYVLSGWWRYAVFVLIELLFNLVFFGTVIAFFASRTRPDLKPRFLPLTPTQAVYFSLAFCLVFIAGGAFINAKLAAFFGNQFDFRVLELLAQGSALNIFAWIDPKEAVLMFLPVILLIGVFVFGLWLRRVGNPFSLAQSAHKARKLLIWGWAGLAAITYTVVPYANMTFGLSDVTSYSAAVAILQKATDFDGDGFGPLTLPRDPDNFDASINPYALEKPGDGVDQDGLGGDLPGGTDTRYRPGFPAMKAANGKNVILVVLETFRADAARARLDGEPVMPFFGNLTQHAAFTDRIYSNYGVTPQAHQTLLFGSLSYAAGDQTLFSWAKGLGYQTFGVSAQSETWGKTYEIARLDTLDRYYDARNHDWSKDTLTQWERLNRRWLSVSSAEVNRQVFHMLDSRDKKRPFALFVNYQDLHHPYFRKEMPLHFIRKKHTASDFFVPANRAEIARQYANAAHFLDGSLEEFVIGLKRRGLYENSVILFTGDHPDSFFEDGVLGHGWTLDKAERRTSLTVVNGQGTMPETLGQDDVAKIIAASLDPANDGKPLRFTPSPGRRVFVLSGKLKRPRAFGFIDSKGLFSYDFRYDAVWPSTGRRGYRPASRHLAGKDRKTLVELARYWETVRLRKGAPRPRAPGASDAR